MGKGKGADRTAFDLSNMDTVPARAVKGEIRKLRSRQARLAASFAKLNQRKQEVIESLYALQEVCPHPQVIESKQPDSSSYRGYRVGERHRICTDCGAEELSAFGSWYLHKEASHKVEWETYPSCKPYRSRRFELCRGHDHHTTYHMVPKEELVMSTEYCREHAGELCPSCKGKPRWHDPSADGHGGLNGGEWITCTTCHGKGVKNG